MFTIQEELAGAPALVVLQNHTKGTDIAPTSIEELPPRCTIGELPAVLDIPADAHIFVSVLLLVSTFRRASY